MLGRVIFPSRDFWSPVPACWEKSPDPTLPRRAASGPVNTSQEKLAPNVTFLFPSQHFQVACETQILLGII